jgi:hypothetical protein
MVGRKQEQVDMGLMLGQVLRDVLVHQGDVVEAVQAACDTRLVRDHRDGDARAVESGDRFRRPLDELDPVNGAHVAMVNDDRAVTIEKDSGPRRRVRYPTATIGHATFTVSPRIVGCLSPSLTSGSPADTRSTNGPR